MLGIPERVEEETNDQIVLAYYAVTTTLDGLFLIGIGSFFLLLNIKLDRGIQDTNIFFILLVVSSIFLGLYTLLVRETIIIDKRLQNVVTINKSPLKYLESIKKMPFIDLKIIKITYNTYCENCDYDSPANDPNESWDISLTTIDDSSVKIYHCDSKLEVEKMAESICKITCKTLTHRTEYTLIPGC